MTEVQSHWITTSKHFGPQPAEGFTVWFTGLSGSGKSTLAELLVDVLERQGHRYELLDGDVVRTHLSKGLGFSKEDRDTNILRIGWVAERLTYHGAAAVCSAISPYREARDRVRATIPAFVEVYVQCSVEVRPPGPQGPVRGLPRRDHRLHRGRRPVRAAGEPRGRGGHRAPQPRGVPGHPGPPPRGAGLPPTGRLSLKRAHPLVRGLASRRR